MIQTKIFLRILFLLTITAISFDLTAQYCMPQVQDAGYGIGIARVRLPTTAPALSIDNSSFVAPGGGGMGLQNVQDFTASDSATLEVGGVYRITINSGAPYPSSAIQVVGWIDFNQNSVFDNNEEVMHIPYMQVSGVSTSLPFSVPAMALLGRTRMRLIAEQHNYPKPTACIDKEFGDIEDYTINIVGPYTASSFVSTNAFQQNFTNASRGATNEILGIKVVANGLVPVLSAQAFTFNTNGSTSLSDITNAKLWYTGLENTFNTSNLIGVPFMNPNGSFSIACNQPLLPDSNYFWLTYDIVDTARTCQVIDAECTNVLIGGVNHIPVNSVPTGDRNITSNQLIPNPDFEDNTICPAGIVSQGVQFPAAPWYCPTTQGTTDYYNSCANISNGGNGAQGVPTNSGGTQAAASGNAYIGMQTNVIEYLTVKLTQPLIKGRAYCASMYVNLADGSALANDGMGMAFAVDSLIPRSTSYLPHTPKVQNPQGSFITSKTNWTKVSGSFIADSAYQYVILGNFRHGGTYSTVTVPGGVVPTYSYYLLDNVSLIENPIVEITGDTLICSNDSAHFVAHPSISIGIKDLIYEWEDISNPGVVIGNDSILGVAPPITKSYVVTVSSCGDSCVGGGKDTITLTVLQTPDATITPPASFCITDAAFSLVAAGPGGVWAGNGITNSVTGIFSPAVAGVGSHTVIYTIAGTCDDADTITVNVIPKADATISPAGPFCDGALVPIQLNAVDIGGTWSGNGIVNTANGTFSPSAAGAGTHKIIYIIGSGDCGDTDSIDIVVNAQPLADITNPPSLCIADAAYQLLAASAGGVWAGNGIVNTATGIFSPTLAGVGSHTVIYSIPGICASADTVTVNVTPAANAGINPAGPFCENDNMPSQLTAVDPGGLWSGTGIINVANGSFSPSVAGVGTHQVIYTISGNCGNADTVNVIVNANPLADAGPGDTITTGTAVNLNGSGGGTYLWSPAGTLNCDTCRNPVANPLQTTRYYVVVTDANGCTDIDSVIISVREIITECGSIYVPNAFSPNGDGQNDELKIGGAERLQFFHLVIYDRWGEKVFETLDATVSWNGTDKEKIKNTGTYIYRMEARCDGGELVKKGGNISLLR